METPSSQSSFLSGPILSPLIRFALPLMLSLLLQAFYGGVDLAVVGKFSPTASVSAVATGSQVMQSITSIITGLTMGVTVLVGKAMGSRESQQAGQVVCSQIRLFTLVAAVLTGAMLLLAPQAARLMNVPEAAMSEAVAYIRICSAGIVFITAYNGGAGSVLRVFSNDKIQAANIINTMTPGDVYQTLTTRHPSAESRRYLYKVNTAQKSYRRR